MRMQVDVHEMDHGTDSITGSITWDGSAFILDPPDAPLLQKILDDPIATGKERLTKADGERFLGNLFKQYRSIYLWCSKPVETEDKNDGQ